MSHEQHRPNWNGPVYARHDLESFFYATLLLSCIYEKPGGKVVPTGPKTQYETWLELGEHSLLLHKINLLQEDDWFTPVQKHFSAFTPWLCHIQGALRFGLHEREGFKLRREVDQDDSKAAFDDATLNGNVTYDMMISTMYTFDNTALATRSPKRQAFVAKLKLKLEMQQRKQRI